MQCMLEAVRTAFVHVGESVFWLADITRMGHVRSDARKFAIESDSNDRIRGTAIFGGSFNQRAIANLAIKASVLLIPARPKAPIKFLATEAEARAYIEDLRRDARKAEGNAGAGRAPRGDRES